MVWYTRFTDGFVDDGLLSGSMPHDDVNNGDHDDDGVEMNNAISIDSTSSMDSRVHNTSTSTSTSVVPIVDGVSLWLEGPSQNTEYLNWTSQYRDFR